MIILFEDWLIDKWFSDRGIEGPEPIEEVYIELRNNFYWIINKKTKNEIDGFSKKYQAINFIKNKKWKLVSK